MLTNRTFIGAATVDITPKCPTVLGGYENRTTPFKSIADSLEANLLEIVGQQNRVFIISTDLLYPGSALRDRLLHRLELREQELFLCASHTHYAPMTTPNMPSLGIADEDYISFVANRIGEAAENIKLVRAAGSCTYHEGALNHSINRRLTCLRLERSGLVRRVGMGPNPAGERDESVRILALTSARGEPIALIWNYACHATDFFDTRQISAAYPGKVRRHLRSEFGEVPVLFLQGFAGDVRPPFARVTLDIKSLVARALLGPRFRPPTKEQWESWSDSMAGSVAAILKGKGSGVQISSLSAKRITVAEDEYASNGNNTKPLTWHVIDCGGFRIVGINAEPSVRYRRLVSRVVAGPPLFTAGCLDQTHCYLPTDDMIAAGGYEVEGFRRLFGFEGKFRPNIENSVVEKLKDSCV